MQEVETELDGENEQSEYKINNAARLYYGFEALRSGW